MPLQLVDVTVFHLHMRSPDELRRRPLDETRGRICRAPADPLINRRFYTQVGAAWSWVDRLVWSDAVWQAYVAQPGLETWVLEVDGRPAGYYELLPRASLPEHGEGVVRVMQIEYFGMLPDWIGLGWGGQLLTHAVERSWARGADLVAVNTCTLDHPSALAHYQARGFQQVRSERVVRPQLNSPA